MKDTRRGWIGVDLDGTLAEYGSWRGATHIGAPIWAMVTRVKKWLEEGREVKIMTARVGAQCSPAERAVVIAVIQKWCEEFVGRKLDVVAAKDFDMIELWDDRAIAVESNTGKARGWSRVEGELP